MNVIIITHFYLFYENGTLRLNVKKVISYYLRIIDPYYKPNVSK